MGIQKKIGARGRSRRSDLSELSGEQCMVRYIVVIVLKTLLLHFSGEINRYVLTVPTELSDLSKEPTFLGFS